MERVRDTSVEESGKLGGGIGDISGEGSGNLSGGIGIALGRDRETSKEGSLYLWRVRDTCEEGSRYLWGGIWKLLGRRG